MKVIWHDDEFMEKKFFLGSIVVEATNKEAGRTIGLEEISFIGNG